MGVNCVQFTSTYGLLECSHSGKVKGFMVYIWLYMCRIWGWLSKARTFSLDGRTIWKTRDHAGETTAHSCFCLIHYTMRLLKWLSARVKEGHLYSVWRERAWKEASVKYTTPLIFYFGLLCDYKRVGIKSFPPLLRWANMATLFFILIWQDWRSVAYNPLFYFKTFY